MDYGKRALLLHQQQKGKLSVESKLPLATKDDLSVAYTPGVAQPCMEIYRHPELVTQYTMKGNFVAVVTDGSAVLGLGNIGPEAALPVMEGKAAIFKTFGQVDAIPICLNSQNVDEIVQAIKMIAPTFGGINLEDISAPRCYEIEKRLKEELNIPVFHDDQHGTAIVVSAALLNALKVVNKPLSTAKIAVCGFGAAGSAVVSLLHGLGAKDLTVVDRDGIVTPSDPLDPFRHQLICTVSPEAKKGSLAEAMKGADVFIGVSAPDLVTKEMASSMNTDSILFAMANPTPEIMPELAKSAGVRIMGTGRSDFPNQVNNSICFPAIFRGALDAHATAITEEMKYAAVHALAGLIPSHQLYEENIIPTMFHPELLSTVAQAVQLAAK